MGPSSARPSPLRNMTEILSLHLPRSLLSLLQQGSGGLCACVHRLYSTPELRDALHHQRRVILRNSSSPQSGLWRLLGLIWSSKGVYERHFLRIYPMSLVALLCIAGFTVITYFLPLLSSSTGAEVLLAPRVCSIFNRTLASQTNNTEYTTVAQSWWTENTVSAGSYAQQCYANSSGSFDCAGFVTDRIPSYINSEAACPFHPDMCQNSTNSLSISTGLVDTNDILGMIGPKMTESCSTQPSIVVL